MTHRSTSKAVVLARLLRAVDVDVSLGTLAGAVIAHTMVGAVVGAVRLGAVCASKALKTAALARLAIALAVTHAVIEAPQLLTVPPGELLVADALAG